METKIERIRLIPGILRVGKAVYDGRNWNITGWYINTEALTTGGIYYSPEELFEIYQLTNN